MTNAISKSRHAATTTTTQLPKGFGRTPKYKTAQQLVERLTHINELQEACIAACDYQRGKELIAAKEQLPHGEYLQALSVMHISSQDASRLRSWYETCQSPGIREFDTAQAEQKLSKHAREVFCRASDTTKDAVVQKINDPAVTKITAAEIKNPDDSHSSPKTSTLSPKTDDSDTLVQPTTERQLDGLPSNSETLQSLLPGVVSCSKECDPRSLSMGQGSDSSNDATGDRVLAEHYIQVQATGSCESYKQAEYHFSCFLELLKRSNRDGWTEREYRNLSQDLAGATKLCTNASESYREADT